MAARKQRNKTLTPMLRHYLEVKAEVPDAILFYRMGDFYELFFDDARTAAPVLEVQLTARGKGTKNEAPMCGVPHHAVEGYIGRLLERGFKVAVCDQVEDPAEAKGLVKREITRVVTPGTVSEPELLDGKEDNFLAAVVWRGEALDPNRGAGAGAFLDVSTGRFFVRRWRSAEEARDDLALLAPKEVLSHGDGGALPEAVAHWIEREVMSHTPLNDDRFLDLSDPKRAGERLADQLGVSTLKGFGLREGEPAVLAAAAALAYARDTQRNDLSHVDTLAVRDVTDRMVLDPTTLANLEVFRTLREGGVKGSLLGVVDRTVTAPGGRTLRDWLRRPLKDPDAVARRHQAVAALVEDHGARQELRELLSGLGDPERWLSRAVLGRLAPREAAGLRDGLAVAPDVLAVAEGLAADSPLLAEIAATDPLADLAAELARVLEDEPAASLKDGGVVAEGVDPDLDEARSLAKGAKRHILALEAREREATGIGSLKVGYNRVFGYYLEVTKTHTAKVPEHYIRKQTLVAAERYVTPEIKELEEKILSAEERQVALEQQHYESLLATVVSHGRRLTELAGALGALDALAGFAELAVRHRYVRPAVTAAGDPLTVRAGRHPVVEAADRDAFVPNDVDLGELTDGAAASIVLLTGPNMGGKSTYLRQVALIVLLAQAGSFVPAEAATVGVVDRIFTRVGASDDLARGESTFMVEMIETANILRNATADSLVVLDEVGRGTATYDGLSLAWAIVEYLHEHHRPKTLFATHYHELTELAALLPGVVNRTLAVKEWDGDIVFLRRVVAGASDKSYGLHVARLAGLPREVIDRAAVVLNNLESQEHDLSGGTAGTPPAADSGRAPGRAGGGSKPARSAPAGRTDQLALFASEEDLVMDTLRATDVDALTPLDALNLLADLRSRLS